MANNNDSNTTDCTGTRPACLFATTCATRTFTRTYERNKTPSDSSNSLPTNWCDKTHASHLFFIYYVVHVRIRPLAHVFSH